MPPPPACSPGTAGSVPPRHRFLRSPAGSYPWQHPVDVTRDGVVKRPGFRLRRELVSRLLAPVLDNPPVVAQGRIGVRVGEADGFEAAAIDQDADIMGPA